MGVTLFASKVARGGAVPRAAAAAGRDVIVVGARVGEVQDQQVTMRAQDAVTIAEMPLHETVAHIHQVGKHIGGEHQVDAAVGHGFERESRALYDPDVRNCGAASTRLGNHPARDVATADAPEMGRQRDQKAADPAAEVKPVALLAQET